MDAKRSIKMIERQIEQLESALYIFDTVVRPRAEADKAILTRMRSQHLKLMALLEKVEKGEEVPQEVFYESVPESLR
jgi:DNA-binding protein H-NS